MKCNRCHRPMVYQKFYDLQGQFWGWRCIFCGDVVDPLILENRHFSRMSGFQKNGKGFGAGECQSG